MAAITNYLESALIDHVLRNTTLTSPTTVYLSLHDGAPSESGEANELAVANGYAREAVTFAADSDGSSDSSGAVTFTADGGSWGTITHTALWDAASGGNSLFHAVMTVEKTIGDTDSITFSAGSITAIFA